MNSSLLIVPLMVCLLRMPASSGRAAAAATAVQLTPEHRRLPLFAQYSRPQCTQAKRVLQLVRPKSIIQSIQRSGRARERSEKKNCVCTNRGREFTRIHGTYSLACCRFRSIGNVLLQSTKYRPSYKIQFLSHTLAYLCGRPMGLPKSV